MPILSADFTQVNFSRNENHSHTEQLNFIATSPAEPISAEPIAESIAPLPKLSIQFIRLDHALNLKRSYLIALDGEPIRFELSWREAWEILKRYAGDPPRDRKAAIEVVLAAIGGAE